MFNIIKGSFYDIILISYLTKSREEINAKLDTLIEENEIIKGINGRHEVDIRRLKRRII